MKQLNSTDGQLIFVETADAPEQIGSLTLYDQSTAEGGVVRFKDILRTFETRLDRSPIFTHKIARVPLNLDHPFWVKDPRFDLEYHLRHIALPKPGDWRQLCIQVARLHAQQIDLSRPLWQAYIIEGLDNVEGIPAGAFALYLKIHHAAADGMASADMYTALHDLKPVSPKGEYGSTVSEWDIPKEPTGLELLTGASRHLAQLPFEMAREFAEVIPEISKSRAFKREHDYEAAHAKPQTRFDTQISRNRVFNALQFPLADIKAMRAVVRGATINDTAVAIVSLALRNYLESKQDLPEKSLIGWIPVNIRSEGERQKSGNAFVTLTTPIHTDIANPKKLLTEIAKTTRNAKAYRENVGDDLFIRLTRFIPAPFQRYLANVSSITAKMGSSAIPANVSISNVPGPTVPVYLAGAKAVRVQGIGLIQHGQGLFHVISSYCDDFMISFLACRDQMPDPQFYLECLQKSIDAFRAMVQKEEAEKVQPLAAKRKRGVAPRKRKTA